MAAAGLNWTDISSLGGEDASLEAIQFCIEHGADVNAFNDLGETALHGAAQRGADKVVGFLAAQGATLDAKNRRGRTPLDDAIGQATRRGGGRPSSRAQEHGSGPARTAGRAEAPVVRLLDLRSVR